MRTYVYIDNFRGFSETTIPIQQVNFLVGENSTGKTSFLLLLETLSNSLFWFFEPRFNVPGVSQYHFLDLVSAASKSKAQFTIGAIGFPETRDETRCGAIVSYSNEDGRPVPRRVSFIDADKIRTVVGKRLVGIRKSDLIRSKQIELGTAPMSADNDTISRCVRIHQSPARLSNVQLPNDFLPAPLYMLLAEQLFGVGNMQDRQFTVPEPFGNSFIGLAPIRTKPRRTYDSPQIEFSPEGEHTPYIIRRRLSSKSQAEDFRAFLERAGRSSGLFRSINIQSYGRSSRAPFELRIVLEKTALGLDNVGYGVSQALPVLVEMFVRPKHRTFTIQQPEVHLHPKAQATFGDLIAEIARRDSKGFFVETHSDFTIDRFRLNVRQSGAIPSQLLYFERSSTGNTVSPIRILDDGSLTSDQPEGYRSFFFNESLALLS